MSYIFDSLNFISKLRFSRLLNYFLLVFTYYYSIIRKKALQPAFPFSISVEPTTSCNLRCPECPSGLRSFTRPTGMLEKKKIQLLLDGISNKLTCLTLYFQGEPYLHPELFDLISIAASHDLYITTSTNGHFLNAQNAKKTVESGLDRLIISIDGTSQDTYQSYRIGGSLEKVTEGAKNIVFWKRKLKKRKPYLIFQFLVVGPNEHQIEEVKKLAQEIGVDEVKFKTAQIYNFENGSPLIPSNEQYSRYRRKSDGTYVLKSTIRDRCWKMWHSCVMTWDGRVLPCCFDKDGAFTMGTIESSAADFRRIWNSPGYKDFRQKILHSRKEIEICRNCTEGTKVWA